jgi:hypothetical protein
MLDGPQVPRWIERLLRELAGGAYAELALVAWNAAPRPRRPPLERLRRAWPTLLYTLYERIDRRLFARTDDPLATVDVSPLLAGVPEMHLTPVGRGAVQRFRREDLERIEARGLDVLLRFGFGILRGRILRAARHGVWSYHHGDNREYRGAPPYFWEIYEENPRSGIVLQVLTEELDGGSVIYRSIGATDLTSVARNRHEHYWKGSAFVARRLRDLWREGPEFLARLETVAEANPYERGLYRRPRNVAMLRYLSRLARRSWKRRREARSVGQWFIAVRPRPRGDPDGALSLKGFTRLAPPQGRFWADPFLLEHAGRSWLFFEDFDFTRGRAVISAGTLDARGGLCEPRVVLERDYHLSYPFVFAWQGELFLIPETSGSGRVELYRALRFPDAWTLEGALLEAVSAVDPTLHLTPDGAWLFVNQSVAGGSKNDELFLYHAPTPLGPFRAHPRNPVVSDATHARPAGRLFRLGEALIRPAQDCTRAYGGAIVLCRVEVLAPDEYREVPIRRIDPDWFPGNTATHTFDRTARFDVLDGRLLVPRAHRAPRS